jgi:spore germination protein KB
MAYTAGMILSIPVLCLYVYLAKQHPNKNLFQINRSVFGPVLGFIISALYLWFFMTLSALTLTHVARLINLTLLPETPMSFTKLILVLVAAWSVKYGPESVTRYGAAVVYTSILINVAGIVFTFNRLSISHFLPLFDAPPANYIQGIHTTMTIPYGETVIFLMLMPAVNEQRKLAKSFIFGFIAGALLLILNVLHDVATLGCLTGWFVMPSLESFRLLSGSQSIGRIDILFATGLVMQIFFRLSIVLYASTLGLAQLLNLENYNTLPFILGVFLVIYSSSVVTDVIQHLGTASSFVPWLWSFFQHFLPAMTAVVYLIQKAIKKKKGIQLGVMQT